jgi:hypothetical protein
VAVVQISRIQVRRGQKNSGSGLPQLASGELGWAIDTQELFIGNGAVSEGAPYVGNTQLLTQHDDLFQYASNYSYRVNDGFIDTNGVQRTLQERLDDRVSVRSFGVVADGTDQAENLQRAIDQLFLNDANKANPASRVILEVEPGQYTFSSTIYIPPFVTLEGAGKEKTVFIYTGTGEAFRTVNGQSQPGAPASDAVTQFGDQASRISLSGFTLRTPAGTVGLRLENCRDSMFKNINMQSYFQFGDTNDNTSNGILINSLSNAIISRANKFENIEISNFGNAVYSDWDITDNKFVDCDFVACNRMVVFGLNTVLGLSGQSTGPFNNTIENCRFLDYEKQAVYVKTGTNNLTINNKFYRGGNLGGNASNTIYSVIQFDQNGNHSENDWFTRSSELAAIYTGAAYLPEVKANNFTDLKFTQAYNLPYSGQFTRLFNLSATNTKAIEIEYLYKSITLNANRTGTIRILYNAADETAEITDEYDYTGDDTQAQNLQFGVETYDNNSDSVVDTLGLMVLNSTSNDDATLYYRIKNRL